MWWFVRIGLRSAVGLNSLPNSSNMFFGKATSVLSGLLVCCDRMMMLWLAASFVSENMITLFSSAV